MKEQSVSIPWRWAALMLIAFVSLAVAVAAKGAPTAPPPDLTWSTQCVDCPRYFDWNGDRSLRLDADGHPHLVYGGDHLYYAWYDGAAWHSETADDSPHVGFYASLALDSVGTPHIAYLGSGIKYAYRTPSGWISETVDDLGVGFETLSFAVDAVGNPHIAYSTSRDGNQVKYAHRVEGHWLTQTVSAGGWLPSLALDASGVPHISYTGDDNNLYYARWTGSVWAIQVVDVSRQVWQNKIAIDRSGAPHIVFRADDRGLVYVHRTGSTWISQTIYSEPATDISLALDQADVPHVTFVVSDAELKYANAKAGYWVAQTVDRAWWSSLVLDSSGNPRISYQWDNNLKYAQWTGSSWNIKVLDHSGRVWSSVSLALDGEGAPQLSYLYDWPYGLRYARWTGNVWAIQDVASDLGWDNGSTSLALDRSGKPHIAYSDETEIYHADWTGSAWTTQTIITQYPPTGSENLQVSLALDSADRPQIVSGSFGCLKGYCVYGVERARWTGESWAIEEIGHGAGMLFGIAFALDGDDQPHVSYAANGDLHYTHWIGSAWITQTVDSGNCSASSIALDSHGNPRISYYCGGSLRYARWTGSAWITETVDNAGNVGQYNSLALDRFGNPRIAYYEATNGDLRYAEGSSGGWVTRTLDRYGDVGQYASLVLDRVGNPHIGYMDGGSYDLKYMSAIPTIPFSLTPDHAAAIEPGGQAIYTHTLQNVGNISDTFQLTWGSSQNWATVSGAVVSGTIALPGTVTLWPGQSAVLTVTVNVPADSAVVGMADTTLVTATSTISPTLFQRATDLTFAPRAQVYLPIVWRN
jgi:hypothetical protein